MILVLFSLSKLKNIYLPSTHLLKMIKTSLWAKKTVLMSYYPQTKIDNDSVNVSAGTTLHQHFHLLLQSKVLSLWQPPVGL